MVSRLLLKTGSTVAAFLLIASCATAPRPGPRNSRWGLAVHGGAGTITREKMTPEREAEIRATLEQALVEGHAVLAKGGSSLDAVTRAVVILEDSPLFNAGKGAVFTHEGNNELDAAVMSGPTLSAGSVAGLRTVKNPILLARAVMERSPHVMMIDEGAERFAALAGLERVDPSYFFTEERWKQLQEKRARDPDAGALLSPAPLGEEKFGTVGAVALDRSGALAAGTSTGGMTNKRFGRVGDVPIIGAGTYANEACAVSATGHGEFFIRYTVAHDICARLQYLGMSLDRAAHQVVMKNLVKAGGEGGVIAMDRQGNVAMPFNSAGMYRGAIDEEGVARVEIFRD